MEESHVEPVESVAQDANMEETANELESKAEETEIDISESQVQNQEVKPDESSKGKALKIIKSIQYSIKRVVGLNFIYNITGLFHGFFRSTCENWKIVNGNFFSEQ